MTAIKNNPPLGWLQQRVIRTSAPSRTNSRYTPSLSPVPAPPESREGEMNWFKDLDIFCKNNHLDHNKPETIEAFRRYELGLPWEEEKVGDCPDCAKPRFRVLGTTRWRCIYCGSTGQIEGAVELTPKQQAAEKVLRKEKQAENRERALKIWDECVPIATGNAMVHTYFRARCLSLDPLPDLDAVMRWHSHCPFGPRNTEPCIVSLFSDAVTDQPTAIHRTCIVSASAGKSERKAFGPFLGSAIKLWPLSRSTILAVGEGIETVLAAVELGVGSSPAWAATVAGNLGRLPVIRGVERLTILADNDERKMGEQAARKLRRRWLDRGRAVAVKIPTEGGADFNDILRGRP